eukprot:CAMPEP_0184300890 /NCGR_PEP_ID=MMETSP1049-20130417/11211_1 /TAXON_ID=77928 /ORGANISM="Proteomonas sulcata, Strain CCMP704" /LENGTH=507 /DNA_ID=CAMNT_0026611731 /DNA_START=70 /DNA_END=1593 /DNA_ORIENTATION=+
MVQREVPIAMSPLEFVCLMIDELQSGTAVSCDRVLRICSEMNDGAIFVKHLQQKTFDRLGRLVKVTLFYDTIDSAAFDVIRSKQPSITRPFSAHLGDMRSGGELLSQARSDLDVSISDIEGSSEAGARLVRELERLLSVTFEPIVQASSYLNGLLRGQFPAAAMPGGPSGNPMASGNAPGNLAGMIPNPNAPAGMAAGGAPGMAAAGGMPGAQKNMALLQQLQGMGSQSLLQAVPIPDGGNRPNQTFPNTGLSGQAPPPLNGQLSQSNLMSLMGASMWNLSQAGAGGASLPLQSGQDGSGGQGDVKPDMSKGLQPGQGQAQGGDQAQQQQQGQQGQQLPAGQQGQQGQTGQHIGTPAQDQQRRQQQQGQQGTPQQPGQAQTQGTPGSAAQGQALPMNLLGVNASQPGSHPPLGDLSQMPMLQHQGSMQQLAGALGGGGMFGMPGTPGMMFRQGSLMNVNAAAELVRQNSNLGELVRQNSMNWANTSSQPQLTRSDTELSFNALVGSW